MRPAGALLMVLLAWLAAGCGPVQSSSAVARAEADLRAAKVASADQDAPYEYTKASLYLQFAKERQGYSDYQTARRFAEEAQRLAMAAKDVAPRNARVKQLKQAPKPTRPGAIAPGAGGRP